jgi:hypothetical protein
MPAAKPPLDPLPPHPLRQDEVETVKQIIRRFYGEDAVIRNYGPDPKTLALHVETRLSAAAGQSIESPYHDCLGALLRDIQRERITLDISVKGHPAEGLAKVAYRQGVIL